MKAEEINKWLGLIKLSQMERESKQPNWSKFWEYFRGLQWDEDRKTNTDIMTVNLVYSTVKVEIPSIYFRNPKLFIKAVKPSAIYRARIQETVLNQDMERMEMKEVMRDMIQDVILVGTSFCKTTYFMDISGQEPEPGDKGQILSLVKRFQGGPTPASVEDENLQVGENGPLMIRIDPEDMAFRIGITDIRDPGFIAQKARLYVEDVKNDPYYQNTQDLQPNVSIREQYRAKLMGYYNQDVETACSMIDAWEVWDVDKGKKFIIAEGHDKALREPEDNEYPYDHPYDILKFTNIRGELWGMSEIEPWLPQQDEYNIHRTLHLMHTRRYTGRKTLVKQGVLPTEEDRENLRSGEDAVVEIAGNPNADVTILPDAQISGDNYRFLGMAKDEIVEVSGTTPYKRGLLQGANTATEANIAETNSNLRDNDRIDLLGTLVKKVMRKVRLCRKEFTPGEDIIQVTDDPKTKALWELWSRNTFTEDVIMEIDYGSTIPVNAQTKMANADALYDRLVQNPTINPQAAAAKLLEAHDERDIPSWFLPPEIIQQQLVSKLLGQQEEVNQIKGVAPGPSLGNVPPPRARGETSAELGGNPLTPGKASGY